MIVKLLIEHHLEFQNLKGGCRGSSESTLVKMSNWLKSHAAAHIIEVHVEWLCEAVCLLLHFTLASSIFLMGICTLHMMKDFVFIAKQRAVENIWSTFVKYEIFLFISSAVQVCINIIV